MHDFSTISCKYGGFSKNGREYIITRPDTPRPWMHVISNAKYCLKITQTCSSSSMYVSNSVNQINPYDHNANAPGRHVYIKDLDTGEFFVPGSFPVNKHDTFQCTYGMGYAKWDTAYNKIAASFKITVTLDDPVEIWTLKIKNNGNKVKSLKIFPYVEWSLLCPENGRGSCIGGEFDEKNNTLFAWKKIPGDAGLKHMAFFSPSFRITEFDCSRNSFIGRTGGLHAPEAVLNSNCNNRNANGEAIISACGHGLTLQPGEEVIFSMLCGVCDTKEEAFSYIGKYGSVQSQKTEAHKVAEMWNLIAETTTVNTPIKEIDVYANTWLKAQVLECAKWTRGSGVCGYRDVLQDAAGVVLFDGIRAKAMLAEALSHQFESGHAPRQWSKFPEWHGHDVRDYRDSSFWIIYALVGYLQESGDMDFLNLELPFFESNRKATVWEHAFLAVQFLFNDRGEHGLSHIGRGDWNDSMNEVGVKGKGESVWLSMALYWALNEMKTLAGKTKRPDEAAQFTRWAELIRKSVAEHAWNGEWYVAAYTDNGTVVGGKECSEGKIHLNAQTWAVFSGISERDRQEKAVASIDKYLNTQWGPPVFYPHYSTYDKELGRITTPCTENGTVYVHAATFKIIADCVLGRADAAIDTINKIMPAMGDPDKNRVEPFVFTNYYCTDAFPLREGIGGHGWFTGTAAWMLQLITEWILGARREYDGLMIDPCIPASWEKCGITRTFRGAVYDIQITRISTDTKGVKSITVDGKKIDGNIIQPFFDGRRHVVKVEL